MGGANARVAPFWFTLLFLVLVFFLAICNDAHAQCAPINFLEAQLKQSGEKKAFEGIANSQRAILEVYLNEESGTWTIVEKKPGTESSTGCIRATGQYGRYVYENQANYIERQKQWPFTPITSRIE